MEIIAIFLTVFSVTFCQNISGENDKTKEAILTKNISVNEGDALNLSCEFDFELDQCTWINGNSSFDMIWSKKYGKWGLFSDKTFEVNELVGTSASKRCGIRFLHASESIPVNWSCKGYGDIDFKEQKFKVIVKPREIPSTTSRPCPTITTSLNPVRPECQKCPPIKNHNMIIIILASICGLLFLSLIIILTFYFKKIYRRANEELNQNDVDSKRVSEISLAPSKSVVIMPPET